MQYLVKQQKSAHTCPRNMQQCRAKTQRPQNNSVEAIAPCGQRRLLSSSGNCALASEGIVCSSDDLYELHLPLLSPIAGRNSNIANGTFSSVSGCFSVSVFDARYITLKCQQHKRQIQISEKFFHYFVNCSANTLRSCDNTLGYWLMVITSETISKRKARFYANLRIGHQYRQH